MSAKPSDISKTQVREWFDLALSADFGIRLQTNSPELLLRRLYDVRKTIHSSEQHQDYASLRFQQDSADFVLILKEKSSAQRASD